MKDEIVDQVVNKYYMRSVVGIKKYGTTLEGNNTDDFFTHALEEAMDLSAYLMKIIEIVKNEPNDQELGKKIRKMVR
jgi:hypothetical protein